MYEALKPCPFCGGEADYHSEKGPTGEVYGWVGSTRASRSSPTARRTPMTDHVAYPGCYCADCVEGTPHERHTGHRGYIVGNGDRTKWRAWVNGMPTWVDDPADATRYGFRSDANAVHAEDDDAWCVVKYEDIAIPSARITGDKDRENPVEGAPLSTVAADRVRLWFFRECNSGTRRQLFSIFGLPLDEIGNQGAERLCFNHILAALGAKP